MPTMSTRATIWALLVGVLFVALVVFFAVRGRTRAVPAMGTDSDAQETLEDRTAPRMDGDWPMFHGGQGLLGRAEGGLARSLKLLWKFETGAEVKSSAAVREGRVFIGSSDEHVYALGLLTGEKLWSYKTEDAIEGTPCVIDGRVFVGSADNFLYALDAHSGELKWKYETDGQILGSANWTRSADGQRTWILVGSYDNTVHCVDAETGALVWAYETDNYVNGSPTVADGMCVFGGCDAMIHVVGLAEGSQVAQIDTGSYIAASAAFLDGQIYVGNYENVFLRADVKTGKIVWQYAQGDAPFFSSPAVGEKLVVFGGRDEYVHCVRRDTGARVWTFKTLGEVNSSPAISGDKVIVGSDDGRLYMLRLADGKHLWSYEIGQPIVSSPAVAGGLVVVGCDDGAVYAFGPEHSVRSEAR